MLNTIRADFYRLSKTKGFWITQGLLIILVLVSILSQAVGSVGVSSPETMDELTNATKSVNWTGIVSVEMLSTMSSLLIYFIIPLLVMAVGYDFSKQTYKNSLTVGVSRTKFYFSKYITLSLLILLQLFYYIAVVFIVGSLINGIGVGFGLAYIGKTCLVIISQYLFLMAIFSVSTFALFLTRSNVAAILATILLPIVISILTLTLPKVTFLKYLDFQGLLSLGTHIDLSTGEIYPYLFASLVTIILAISSTLITFNQQEL
ncbi:ABC transporter permease [Vagococcus salmoninarum]|uniref:ABC transporter permease n=1 Tax=Vagococcus salmoninarum TaxID=2739 RepID=UPI003F94DA2F